MAKRKQHENFVARNTLFQPLVQEQPSIKNFGFLPLRLGIHRQRNRLLPHDAKPKPRAMRSPKAKLEPRPKPQPKGKVSRFWVCDVLNQNILKIHRPLSTVVMAVIGVVFSGT